MSRYINADLLIDYIGININFQSGSEEVKLTDYITANAVDCEESKLYTKDNTTIKSCYSCKYLQKYYNETPCKGCQTPDGYTHWQPNRLSQGLQKQVDTLQRQLSQAVEIAETYCSWCHSDIIADEKTECVGCKCKAFLATVKGWVK